MEAGETVPDGGDVGWVGDEPLDGSRLCELLLDLGWRAREGRVRGEEGEGRGRMRRVIRFLNDENKLFKFNMSHLLGSCQVVRQCWALGGC